MTPHFYTMMKSYLPPILVRQSSRLHSMTSAEKRLNTSKKKDNAVLHVWYFSWSEYTPEAREFAKKNNITLIDENDFDLPF